MPVRRTTLNGKPAYQWGTSGKKYTYTAGNKASRTRAKQAAERQGRTIESRGYKPKS